MKVPIFLSLLYLVFGEKVVIEVGKDSLSFTPDAVNVTEGSTVEFKFFGQNYSVSASSYDKPCAPASDGAFFSGALEPVSIPS